MTAQLDGISEKIQAIIADFGEEMKEQHNFEFISSIVVRSVHRRSNHKFTIKHVPSVF